MHSAGMFNRWPKVICSHLLAAAFSTSKLLANPSSPLMGMSSPLVEKYPYNPNLLGRIIATCSDDPGMITQPNWWPSAAQLTIQPSVSDAFFRPFTQGNFSRSTERKFPLSQTGFFRSDSPIQNWMRQPTENSVRWIVPIDIMSNVGEMISPRLYCGVFPIWWGKTKSFRFSLPPLSIKLNLACLPDIMTVGSRTIPAKRVLAPRIAAKK